MLCPTCGAPFNGVGNFCSQCGARVLDAAGAPIPPAGYGYQATPQSPPLQYGQPYPPAFTSPRVARNLQLLGILWVCLGVFRLAKGLLGMFFLNIWSHHRTLGPGFPFSNGGPFLSAMMPFALTLTIVLTGLSLLVAYGLTQRRPWGRTLAIVMSILSMLNFPFGTGLGIYTLWVLAPAASAIEYESIMDRTNLGF